jgi:predicted nucleotidyltransferase
MADSRAELNADLMDLAKRYAAEAIERLGDQIVSIALYGSVARGEAGPGSDIDLFVVLTNAPPGMLNRRRLLDPVRESLTFELERMWNEGVYVDFVEVIRTRSEAEKFHPLYLDMSQEAVLLYDRDRFLERVLAEVGEELERTGAKRKFMGNFWFWDLSGASGASGSSLSSIPDEVAEP